MVLDFLFHIWRRLRGHLQWWFLWFLNSKFMVSVSGVVFDESGNILLQRHRHWVPDVWGLPGGIVQRGETLESAFEREVQEETNLKITDIELLSVESSYRLRMEVYFQARLLENDWEKTMKLQKSEIIDARFFHPDRLPVNLLPMQRKIIEKSLKISVPEEVQGGIRDIRSN
jgi:8-oxo-dGTP diphosphatase